MDRLKKAVQQFREERDWGQFNSPKNLAMALTVECAELAEHFQWLSQSQSRNLPADKKEAVKEELGDVLIYLVNLADVLGVDLLEAGFEKLAKNRNKYPAQRVKGKALKYDEYE